jgi:hypothetical protein
MAPPVPLAEPVALRGSDAARLDWPGLCSLSCRVASLDPVQAPFSRQEVEAGTFVFTNGGTPSYP